MARFLQFPLVSERQASARIPAAGFSGSDMSSPGVPKIKLGIQKKKLVLRARRAGKLEGMIVLPDNPLTISPDKRLGLKVDMTIAGGKVLYDKTQNHD